MVQQSGAASDSDAPSIAQGSSEDPAGLLERIARGILVERLGRGQVDPRRGEFRLEVESGRMIDSGEAGRPVAGATAVVQPGGSVRDAEVVQAADRLGLAMIVTGTRHFRH